MNYNKIKKEILKKASAKRAKSNEWFFKTGIGQYGEGDKFIGISMPNLRILAKKYQDISFKDIEKFFKSKIHEERMFALIVLTYQFEKAEKKVQEKIYKFYLKNTKYINNWDLVDTSAHKIVGAYIQQKPKAILKKLVRSKNMWERRIAVIATFQLIKMGRLKETFELSKMLLTDDHDLMHKAVGWMLREAGKKDIKKLEAFLKKNHAHMPRTMLRYSIEKFPEAKRKKYLKGIV
jgi:3-methyladenine DNA glycosylase AlkD